MCARHASYILLLSILLGQFPLAAQNVQVSSAVPNSAAQGTTNLDVAIGGSGFKHGAKTQWFVSGTTDPGGITVNSTAFVSSSQLTANITVSSTATISSFDIVVTNTSGSSGKGTGLFSVSANGPQCNLAPLPSQLTLVTTLNNNTYTGGLGTALRARHATLGGMDVLVVAVGSTNTGQLQIFFVDPVTGAVLDGTVIGSNALPQPHISKFIILNGTQIGVRAMAMGDLNADGVPDIVIGNKAYGAAFAFVGSVDANGILSYSDEISFPPGPGQSLLYGWGVAMGDLDGVPGDEVAVADPGGYKGSKNQPGGVYIYHFSAGSFTLKQTLTQSAYWVAIGDVTGDTNMDVIACCGSAGAYVYPGPSLSNPITFSASGRVGAANVDGGLYTDLIIGNVASSSTPNAGVYSGLVSAGQQTAFTVTPVAGLDGGWLNDLDAGDINGDGLADILIGAPNTQPSNACPKNTGTAYVFLTNAASPHQPTTYALEPPVPGGYGYSMAAAAGTRLFFVGAANGGNGEVYVYKVN
jgi:hypothetical protein